MHAGTDQIEPDRRIRRNWAFCRRLWKGGRDELGKWVGVGRAVGGKCGQALPLLADAACGLQLVADVLREQISRGLQGVRCRQ